MSELDHTTVTSKDIFIAKLGDGDITFGLLDMQDYASLFRKLIELKLVEFYHQKEHRACVALFKSLGEFYFLIKDTGRPYHPTTTIHIRDGDFIELSEVLRANDYLVQSHSTADCNEHLLFMDCDKDKRHRMYKAFNFDEV